MTTNTPMQLGMVGLGRMGANLVRRLMRDGHSCVVFDVNADAIKDALAATRNYAGATGTISIDASHDAIKPVVVVTVRDKKFAYVTQVQSAR